jgi:hypothetical protein
VNKEVNRPDGKMAWRQIRHGSDGRHRQFSQARWLLVIVKQTTNVLIFFSMVQQSLVGQGLLIIEASRSHSDTSHSVGLLWTSDQPNAETSTWQNTTLTRYRHPCHRIRTRNPSKQTAADPHLRPRGYWDQCTHILSCKNEGVTL